MNGNNPFQQSGESAQGGEGVNLLLALPYMITGGADTVLLQVAEQLSRHGFAVSCLTSLAVDNERLGDNSAAYARVTREIFHLSGQSGHEEQEREFVFRLIESKKIAVLFIVGCELLYHLLPELKLRFPGLKVVDQLFNEFGHLENNRRYARFIDFNIVATELLRTILVNHYDEADDRVRVIIHGVDIHEQFNRAAVMRLPAPADLPAGGFVAGFFGRFSEEKCPAMFVAVIEALRGLENLSGVMTGGGPEYRDVKRRIAEQGLQEKILAPGFVADIRPYLARSSVVVIPSLIEGIPIILMEAFALGIPVVASRVGGIPDMVTDGYNGYLCEPGDVAGFAEKIHALYADAALRAKMGEHARRYAEQHLDRAAMLAAYLDVFRRIAAGSGSVDAPAVPPAAAPAPADAAAAVTRPGRTILLVMYGWNESGGGTRLPRSIACALVRRGYRVAVFYASLRNDAAHPPYSLEEGVEDGVRLFGLFNRPALFIDPDNPQREIHDPQVLQQYCRVLDEVRPDLVHYHNFHGLTLALAAETSRRRIPGCFSPHNYYMIDPELYLLRNGLELWGGVDPLLYSEAVARNPHLLEWYRRRIETTLRVMNEWVELTLTSSRRQRELLVQYGAERSRMPLIHQASSASDELWSNPAFSQQAQVPSAALRIGVVGGLMPIKGVHILVAAAQAFQPGEVELHLFGTPVPGYQDVLQTLDRRGLTRFHGEYSSAELPAIASRLDVAVLASVVEDCAPLTVLELHAMRLPVIGARIGGIPDFVTEGVDGILYAPYDIAALTAIIRAFLQQPALLRNMRRSLTGPVHSFSRYLDQLEHVYGVLLSGERPDADALSLTIKPRRLAPPDSCGNG